MRWSMPWCGWPPTAVCSRRWSSRHWKRFASAFHLSSRWRFSATCMNAWRRSVRGQAMLDRLKRIILFCFYLSQLWRLVAMANRGRLVILMYHGVTDQPVEVWTQVPVAAFERQMRYISDACTPISLDDALDRLDKGRLPGRPVVVTFDDGFLNNREQAHPILQKYGVPATIYLTTSFVAADQRYDGLIWTDYVYSLLQTATEERIDLSEFGAGRYFLTDYTSRGAAKEVLCSRLKRLPDRERQSALQRLAEQTKGRVSDSSRAIFAPLSWDDVRAMAADPLVTFGAHTVGHPILTQLPHQAMIDEITTSQETIKDRTGEAPDLFAYPNGTREDFDETVKAAVAERYRCAVSTIAGLNDAAIDRYELRRIGVGNDMPLWEFKLQVSGSIQFINRLLGR
ncbi:polysaccharide deacetylase family protein [candidate division GN15 bacterium]|nr:polysaccharide deacetylase family protein [candidate division GN15 bacterium]